MKRKKPLVKKDVSSAQASVTIKVILRFVIRPVSAASIVSGLFAGASYAFSAYQSQQAQSLACPADVRAALEHQRYPNEPIDQLFWQDNPEYEGMQFSQGIPAEKLIGWHNSKKRINVCKVALVVKPKSPQFGIKMPSYLGK
jgi:hypothetical protein